MEVIKKKVQMVMTTGTTACTSGSCYVIIPDLTAVYYFKIGLSAEMRDIGFFDAYTGAFISGGETFYALEYNGDIFTDNNGDRFTI